MLESLNQLAEVAAMIIALIVCVGVLIFAIILFPLLSPRKILEVPEEEKEENQKPAEPTRERVVHRHEPPPVEKKESKREGDDEDEFWKKYPQVYTFEILYWRGVSKPWWWNNFARDLVSYARDYLPHKKLDMYQDYNSNSSGEDFQRFKPRIKELKLKKLTGYPLVVINEGKEMYSIESTHDYEAMLDRIDAEWYRHYRFVKTWRK